MLKKAEQEPNPTIKPGPMKIEDLIMKDSRQGTGLIIKYSGKYIFAVGKESFWQRNNKGLTITYTAVGGSVEPEEDFLKCAYREAEEELGTPVEIISSNESIFYDFETRRKKKVVLEESTAPWIIYNMSSGNQGLSVCVYIAKLKTAPKPLAEIPALILLTSKQVISNELKPLSVLLEEGAEIIEQRKIPRDALMMPFGSAEILKTLSLEELANL